MRKVQKSFTVEVKRRPAIGSKKPQSFMPEMPEATPQHAAEAIFRKIAPAPSAPESAASAFAGGEGRRILPCLVTEAALDAAKAEALSAEEIAPRPRGRPRKERKPDDLAPLAPRKRGRPRKTQATPPVERPAQPAPRAVVAVETAPARPVAQRTGARIAARRSAVAELPRAERWKRRLPKALR